MLGHGIELLEDGVNAVVVDPDAVLLAEDVRDPFGALLVELVQLEDTLDEVGRILGVWISARRLERRNRVGVTVLFGELLDPSTADLELLRDQGGIHTVINNTLTDPDDIILIKLHFTWWLVRQIMPTKSLAYTTPSCGGIERFMKQQKSNIILIYYNKNNNYSVV